MENYTMVKTEVQPNGEILLYYVDENAATEDGSVVTTIDQSQLEQLQEHYVLEEVPVEDDIENMETCEVETITADDESGAGESYRWVDEETRRLLIFYIDNKAAFQNNSTTKKHLWSVACKTILTGKNMHSCEMKLQYMKKKYGQLLIDSIRNKVNAKMWPYYELCHQAFHDDSLVTKMLRENNIQDGRQMSVQAAKQDNVMIKKTSKSPDEKVKQMLELYLQYKKEHGNDYSLQRHTWEKIAIEIGEDADYWHKRFLNYKQHYIRMLEKKTDSVTWPYMKLFEQIYADDEDFIQKHGRVESVETIDLTDWDETERTVLVKYCFDSFDEFQDRTIPNSFLWNEVGRLLDRTPDSCKEKYEELKAAHLNLYLTGGYDLRTRKPIAILFDNIISKETGNQLKPSPPNCELNWPTEKTDEFVQFLLDNIEVFKDPICYYVCLAAVAIKLGEHVQNCKDQWTDLTTLYKSIVDSKKEDPELQIFWRYIDIFDRIFDYGMDTTFLEGYEKPPQVQKKSAGSKKVKTKTEDEDLSDDDDFEEKSSGKRSRGTSDPLQTKILEYYLRNKDKFATTPRKKQALWEVLARQVGISAEQCAHRFRNLKQVYTMHIQREINKPDRPVLWPYYALCKKVFGYRAIKSKLKNDKVETDGEEEWSTKEIKMLINHFGRNLDIDADPTATSKWKSLAKDINKSESSCRDKFLELRKSYRKIKTMTRNNPDCKITWKFFRYFDAIYKQQQMEQAVDDKIVVPIELPTNENKDDDFQCFIVIQDGEEIPDLNNTQIITKDAQLDTKPIECATNPVARLPKWTKQDKLRLLQSYYDLAKENEGKLVNIRDMWNKVTSEQPNRSRKSCRKMYMLLKSRYKELVAANQENRIDNSQIFSLMRKIQSVKQKLVRSKCKPEVGLKEMATYTDVVLPVWKVEKALRYYLAHVDEFVSPKYDKYHVWLELAKKIEVPVNKVFKKVNYLKQVYNNNEDNSEKVKYEKLLKEIQEKEFICKIAISTIPTPMNTDTEEPELAWTDDEIEELLLWYLKNLKKFKNPKFVPSYLWLEASNVLQKSALACSKKMMDIRSQYSAMVKDNPEGLNSWRFLELCRKIYGTGKKNNENSE